VRSNHNVATFIKSWCWICRRGSVDFRAGGYIQIDAPSHTVYYKDFAIESEFRDEWDRYNMWQFVSKVDEPVVRAYSMANYPDEKGVIILNVRIASPPPRLANVPPGKMSSYIFNLKPGDQMTISGPYGQFLPNRQTPKWSLSAVEPGWRDALAYLRSIAPFAQQTQNHILVWRSQPA
jgi:Na+-transporting NADH:ubiquinone oxidoreductase subunit F